jgi:FixJ family two-component response regulator
LRDIKAAFVVHAESGGIERHEDGRTGTLTMKLGRGVVLVVDDDLAVCEALKFTLEIEGLPVRVCRSGDEALHHPDLPHACCLVIDYRMPGMDGLQLLERLAHQQCEIPVIMITGQPSLALRRRAKAAGVRRVLEKPLMDSALVDCIREIEDCC